MNLSELTTRLHAIRDQNHWRALHSPKNLAMADRERRFAP